AAAKTLVIVLVSSVGKSVACSLPFAKYAICRGSGDQNGFDAPSEPSSRRSESLCNVRTQSPVRPVASSLATKARYVPSGDSTPPDARLAPAGAGWKSWMPEGSDASAGGRESPSQTSAAAAAATLTPAASQRLRRSRAAEAAIDGVSASWS